MRKDREIDQPQRDVIAGDGGLRLEEGLSDSRCHHHASGAQPDPDGLFQRRQEIPQAGLSHPVRQVHGITAIHQQDVCFADPGFPAAFIDAGQSGEFEHAQGFPSQLAHRAIRFSSTDESPGAGRACMGMPIQRSGNAESIRIGDRFSQQREQRVPDAGVLDSARRQKEFHWNSPCDVSRTPVMNLTAAARRPFAEPRAFSMASSFILCSSVRLDFRRFGPEGVVERGIRKSTVISDQPARGEQRLPAANDPSQARLRDWGRLIAADRVRVDAQLPPAIRRVASRAPQESPVRPFPT